MPIAADYPLLEVFWTITLFAVFVVWVWLVVWLLMDNFRRDDHGGVAVSRPTIGGWNVAVSIYTRHPDEAFEFLAFITGERSLKLRAIEGAYLPTRKSTYEDPEVLEANPHFARFFEVFRNTRNRPRSPHYPRASDVIQENVHGALAGELDSRSAARAIVSKLGEILVK